MGGELFNFAAFAFAPASLIAPLGGWSVAAAAFFASRFLGERLKRRRVVGIVLCIVGSVFILTGFPSRNDKNPIMEDAWVLRDRFKKPEVYKFLLGQISLALVLALIASRTNLGQRSSLVYLTICCLSEGISVITAKGGSTLLRVSLVEKTTKHLIPTLEVLSALAMTLPLQVVYLNKAMALFHNSEVIPRHYVLYTIVSCLCAQVVFKEFGNADILIVQFLLAVFITSYGVKIVAADDSAVGAAKKKSDLPA
mmetsp:Transcript_1034/g.3219  ORF Transcript_1034/g.3219 Transcript_1034/m.3219 type:complete len:253 (-) Transcript_1034:367-1125(-)